MELNKFSKIKLLQTSKKTINMKNQLKKRKKFKLKISLLIIINKITSINKNLIIITAINLKHQNQYPKEDSIKRRKHLRSKDLKPPIKRQESINMTDLLCMKMVDFIVGSTLMNFLKTSITQLNNYYLKIN